MPAARVLRGCWLRALCLLASLVLFFPAQASAQQPIPPGHEDDVAALLAPLSIGSEREGWTLQSIGIEQTLIHLRFAGPEGAQASLRLRHPYDEDAELDNLEHSRAFLIEREAESPAALDPWVEAIQRNDDGSFWTSLEPPVMTNRLGQGSAAAEPEEAPMWGLAALLTLLLALPWALVSWRMRPRPRPTIQEAPEPLRTRIMLAAGVGLVCTALTLLLAPSPPLHSDTLRDLFLARNCLAGEGCQGATTSFHGFDQHTGWVRLLALFYALDLDPHRMVVLANGFGAALFMLTASDRLHRVAALGTTAIAQVCLLWAAGSPTLWNPSLAPLAYALLFAGVLRSRPARDTLASDLVHALAAGLGAALAMETHIVGVATLAIVVFGLRLHAARPLASVALALSVAIGVELATSWTTIVANLAQLSAWWLPLMVGGLAAVWGLATVIAAKYRPDPWLATAAFALALGSLPMLAAILLLGHFLQLRYFAETIVPAALLLGFGVDKLATTLPRRVAAASGALYLLLYLTGGWRTTIVGHSWNLRNIEQLEQLLLDEGATPEGLFFALRGPHASDLAQAMMLDAQDSSLSSTPTTQVIRTLSILGAADELALPPGWRALPFDHGHVGLFSPLRSWLDNGRAELCFSTPGEPSCVTLGAEDWQALGDSSSFDRFHAHWLPRLEALRRQVEASAEKRGEDLPKLYMRVPLIADAGERTLQLFDSFSQPGGWRFAMVEGIEQRGEPDGKRVTLVSDGEREGTLTFEYSKPPMHAMPLPPMNLLELGPDELALLELACADHQRCREQ
ncbi:hypothetical protein G6O69_33315 [Pseudenhygromyxa sp. WMMC2535]|uniref:hypothetical protein n=1 Tax=Pseudenhygromyxa sp. WMMC2535 TaxID=2712867 RepID=UPI001553C87D|nr:hypothetical protein [Pseudenhygromyxa sp. WMMC2535]NVB42749.1 hypothetical protein [Pseudenhygromyxa sp. WMMC2535]